MPRTANPRRRSPAQTFRDRIVELRRVSVRELRQNPANWRVHPAAQRAALRGVLAEVGIADALIAYPDESGALTLIDGHLRADMDPDQEWPVLVVNVTAEEAKLLLATHDPLAAMAQSNTDALMALLGDITPNDQAVTDMLEALANGERQPLAPHFDPPPDAGDDPAAGHAPSDVNVLQVPVSPEQRDTIMQAVRKAKADTGVETTTEAICLICERFMES